MYADWWIGFDKDNNHVQDLIRNSVEVDGMTIKYKIQKNRRNNEPVTFKSDPNSEFCVVKFILSMIKRAADLNQPDHLPLAVYRDKNGKVVYLTADTLTAYIREVALRQCT